jgi:hypothetical protein
MPRRRFESALGAALKPPEMTNVQALMTKE